MRVRPPLVRIRSLQNFSQNSPPIGSLGHSLCCSWWKKIKNENVEVCVGIEDGRINNADNSWIRFRPLVSAANESHAFDPF